MTLATSGLTIPPAAHINAAAGPRRLAVAAARSVVPLIYGQYRITGMVLNVLAHASNTDLVLVQVLWAHAGDSVNDVLLNDEALPSGASITNYTGSQVAVDSALSAAFTAQSITYTDTLAGYMYSVLHLPKREFTGQLNVSARIRGRKLYDPRLDSTVAGGSGSHRLATPSTWAWSDNPSLALADYLYSSTYGAGETVDWVSVQAAANANDALLSGAKKRLIGAAFTQAVSAQAMSDTLRAYASCWLIPTSAGIKLLADADAAAVATYAHASGAIASLEGLTRRDLGDAPTAVEVIYTDTSATPWRDASVIVNLSGAGSTRPWRLSTIRLPGIHRFGQAKREATERLNKFNLNDLSCTLEVFDIGIRHEIGDIVNITHPLGPTDKPMRVVDSPEMPGPGRWRLPLVEHDPAAYSTLVESEPTYTDTGRVVQVGPPPSVTALAYTLVSGAVRLTWDEPSISDYRSTYLRRGASWAAGTKLDGTAGSTIATGGQFDWRWPSAGTYTVRARHMDRSGQLSTAEATLSVTVTANDLALQPTQFTGGGNLLRNSSFEVDSDGDGVPDYWTGVSIGTGLTVTPSQSTNATHGRWSFRMQISGISAPTSQATHQYFQTLDATLLPKVQPGKRYVCSAEFLPGHLDYSARISVFWYDAALSLLSSTNENTALTSTTDWTRVWSSVLTAPANAAFARVGLGLARPSVNSTTSTSMRIDAAMFMTAESAAGYWPADSATGDLLPGAATTAVSAFDEDETVSGLTSGHDLDVCSCAYTNDGERDVKVFIEGSQELAITVTAGAGTVRGTPYWGFTADVGITVPVAAFTGSDYRDCTSAGGTVRWRFAQGWTATIPPGKTLTAWLRLESLEQSGSATWTVSAKNSSARILVLK